MIPEITHPTKLQLNALKIGDITIDTPLSLAPMAGQTNRAFRDLCREMGDCGLVCTELISSHAMQNKGSFKHTLKMFDWDDRENPFAVQLFGSDPWMMAEAAKIVVDHGAQIVDINMGCWVPKVAKKGGGAALLKDVCTATEVVRAVVDAVPSTPVTVKIRSGWTQDDPTGIPFAKAAEQVGAKAIAVHARYAQQGFTGVADWSIIREVKQTVSIPVLGNGDVFSAEDAARMFTETGCDGVMVGRGALGNPWIFRQIAHFIRTGEHLPAPTWEARAEAAVRQAHLTLETTNYEPIKAIRELRGQLIKYCDGMPDATTIREKVVRAESFADIQAAFAPLLS
ncbi:MAG: tRNA dihydrouridine synthase DusB [Aggregatilineales bacterium]